MSKQNLILLDRDGVINVDLFDYVTSVEEWKEVPGSYKAISILTHAGYLVVVVTNQAGLHHGRYDIEALNKIHAHMNKEAEMAGGRIGAIIFCPHTPDEKCNCRKPQPSMLTEIAERLEIQLNDVFFIGDKLSDLEAAVAAGAIPILVKTGYGESVVAKWESDQSDKNTNKPEDLRIFDDLLQAATALTCDDNLNRVS